jgi:imidazolonepropionase-like amidohydrolase
MKARLSLLVLISLFACGPSVAQDSKPPAAAQSQQVIAFTGVNVLPMDRERVIENQNVLVRGDRIVAIGSPGDVKIPGGALRIDGRGKYLMPGLAEMHGHLPHPNQGEQLTVNFLKLFVASGVTTVRVMYGFENSISVRERVARGELLGPKLAVACPAMSGNAVKSPEEGDRLVREYKKAGYDLLKIHEGLSAATYNRIVATANEVGIQFGGHVPNDVGVEKAIQSKQYSIDHIDNYVEGLEADDSPVRNADPQTRAQKWFEYLDEKRIPVLVAATRDAKIWIVPTQDLWRTLFGVAPLDELKQRPELKYVPQQMVNQWINAQSNTFASNNPKGAQRVIEMRDKLLKALFNGGARIALGSDAPQRFSVPGFSLVREMQAMVKAGLTPFQALQSGTLNAALYFNAEDEFGTVRVGRRADLILLDENPLNDVANVGRRAGVMLRGRWMPETEIQKMLGEIAKEVTGDK